MSLALKKDEVAQKNQAFVELRSGPLRANKPNHNFYEDFSAKDNNKLIHQAKKERSSRR